MPLHLELTQGQDHDITQAEALLAKASAAAIVADTAYDSDKFRAAVQANGMELVVKNHPNRKTPKPVNDNLYSLCFNVERFFHSRKRFRRVASRYEKTARNFMGMAHLACSIIWVGVGLV